MAQKFEFTDDQLAAIAPPEQGQQLRVFDAGCPGLGLWIGANGAKVFFAYRWVKGEPRPTEMKVGPFPGLTVEQAREQSRPVLIALAKAAAPVTPANEDDDALRTAGECKKCLDMTMLNAKGLCAKCRPLPPCVDHPETLSSARCSSCSQPFCDACLTARRCASCAAKVPKRGAPAGGAVNTVVSRGISGLAANRKLVFGGAVGLLVVVQAGMFAWQHLEEAGPAATPEQHYQQRVSIALGGIVAFRGEKQRLPADAKELAAFLTAKGATPPALTGATAPLPKHAVVYVQKDDQYELYATTGEGQRFEDARPLPKAD